MRWLLILRCFVIAGESAMLFAAIYVVNYPIPKDPLWTLISLSMIVNSLTWYRLQSDHPVSEHELFFHLILDVIWVASLLYFTGGATNPLVWFFLLPLIITATILPQFYAWLMVGLTSACYTLLIRYHIPLPDLPSLPLTSKMPQVILELQSRNQIDLFVFANWSGYLLIAGAVAYFVVAMANTLRQRDRKLSEAREQTLRQERVIALGTLATGAAHEMGTPLGTMAILAHEIQHEYCSAEYADLNSKMKILREQIDRCKEALSVLSASAGTVRADSGQFMSVKSYLRNVIGQWQSQQPYVKLEYQADGIQPEPTILAERALTHSLINILNNAGDVSPDKVDLKVHWNSSLLVLEVRDYGPGLSQEVAEKAGKTPLTTKAQGLGVGLFLANATIERLGGTLNLVNMQNGGASTRIEIPLIPSVVR